jgi:hypothetical protein
MSSYHKQGQAAVTDLFIAISVFIILITITTLTWDLYRVRLNNRIEFDDMIITAFQISDVLIKTKGIPDDWEKNTGDPEVIGLIATEKILSAEKVNAFVGSGPPQLTYEEIKNLFNINEYDFYFTINKRNPDGTKQLIANQGLVPTGRYNVNLARLIIYQGGPYPGEPHFMEFSLWK